MESKSWSEDSRNSTLGKVIDYFYAFRAHKRTERCNK